MVKRHQAILELLDKDNYISVSHLSELLKVSTVTIRKDLKLLEDKGLAYRTHGGASIQNPYINDRHVSEKEKLNVSEKEAIAKAAAELIAVNDSIMIASGTTMQYLAIAISIDGPINVTTSSLNVALELTKSSQYGILQLGGNVRHSSFSVTGHFSHAILENISCKLLFLGADGIDVNHGCTTTSLEEAMLNKKMMGSAQKVIVLADSSKFNRKGFGKICMLSEVDLIITDSGLNKNIQQDILDAGVELHIAQ